MRRASSRARSFAAHAPIGWVAAFVRFMRDPEASLPGKLFVLGAIAYVVMPLDAIPDVIPVVGWLDDLGVAAIAATYVMRVLTEYRKDSQLTG